MAQVGPLRKHLGPGCARLLRLCSRCCSEACSSDCSQLFALSLKVLTSCCLPVSQEVWHAFRELERKAKDPSRYESNFYYYLLVLVEVSPSRLLGACWGDDVDG
jgi:hypothetical protein